MVGHCKLLNFLCFSIAQINVKTVTEYSLLFAKCEKNDLHKCLKDYLLTEKLVADEPDALQTSSHSLANVDDL